MGNKFKYLLICVLATLAISACTPSNSINNAETVPKIGDKVPNISWTTISGESIDLDQFKGSWVLLCYWCPCPAHREDILTLRAVYDSLYDKNIKVVVIEDNATKWPEITLEGFAKENNLPFYLVQDNKNSVNAIKPEPGKWRSRPIYFLIDTNGNLHDIKLGEFYYSDKPSTKIPTNDFEAQIPEINFDRYQRKCIDVLIFLYDAMTIKFDDIVITDITTRGATIRWKTDKAVLSQLNVDSPLSFWTEVTEPSTNHEWIFDDILPDKTWIFTATASSYDRGKLPLPMPLYYSSSEYSFATLSDISNVKVSKITDKSAVIYWETFSEGTGTAKLSIYTTGRGYTIITTHEDLNLTKEHIFIVDNLKPDQLYTVDIKSEDSIGRFDTYHFGFVTQPLNYETVGVEIFNINVSDITDKGARITWSTDKVVSCQLCYTKFCYLEDKSYDHEQILSKLEPGTEYWVQLVVEHGGGVSDVFNFKTLKATEKADMK